MQDGDEWRTETETEYAARVLREVRAFSLDVDVTKAGRTTQSELIDVGDVYLPSKPDTDVAQLTTVAVIDTANPSAGPVSSATYAGSGGTTYASRDALYVVNPVWTGGGETSNVVKFGLDGTNAEEGREILANAGIPESKLTSEPTMLDAARAAVAIAGAN